MSTQPEALRLADFLDSEDHMINSKHIVEAAAELRRLYELNQDLLEALIKLLDMHECCEAGFPPETELRFAIRDMARAAIAKARGEK